MMMVVWIRFVAQQQDWWFPPPRHTHFQLLVLLLEVFVFVGVAVGKLVDLDAILLDLLADLHAK